MDESCCTLLLQENQYVMFAFDTPRVRQFFEVCMKVVVLAKAPRPAQKQKATESPRPETTVNVRDERQGAEGLAQTEGNYHEDADDDDDDNVHEARTIGGIESPESDRQELGDDASLRHLRTPTPPRALTVSSEPTALPVPG